jgi:EAL domain-containing protein (putative c-di-GMP-specific phosphodiesterase class I)
MQALQALGVRFSLDDFGTGYASLAYLKRFPFEQLKIDRSFIRDIASDPDDAAIVSAIVAMGNALRLNVVAEGVETEEQRAYLIEHGCRCFQGYLFGRPMSFADFESRLPATL